MQSSSSRRVWFRRAGIAVLLAGWSVGGLLYWHGFQRDEGSDNEETALSSDNSRAYQNAMGKNVGAVGLLEARWSQSLARLGEPGPLGITIIVVSGLAAGGCFWVAARLPR